MGQLFIDMNKKMHRELSVMLVFSYLSIPVFLFLSYLIVVFESRSLEHTHDASLHLNISQN